MLSSGPVSEFSLLRHADLPAEIRRGGGGLPSRVADNLFWLGRYAERAEGLTRLLLCVLVRPTETSRPGRGSPELPALLRAASRLTESHARLDGETTAERVAVSESELLAVIHDTRRFGSLASVLGSLSQIAGSVRDRISTDMWRVLRDLGKVRRLQGFIAPGEPGGEIRRGTQAAGVRTLSAELDLLDGTILTLAAFGGLAMESMTRGNGWRFLDMGRRLERSLNLLSLVRSTLSPVPAAEASVLEAVLEIADSSMTYRRRYQGSLEAGAVLDLLLADEANPRSLACQLAALADDVENLPRDANQAERTPEQKLMLSSLTALRLADVRELAKVDASAHRPALEELLGKLAAALPALSEVITQKYLSHLQTARHLSALDNTV